MCCLNISLRTCVRHLDRRRGRVVKSYLHMGMCVYVHVRTKKKIAVDYVSVHWPNVNELHLWVTLKSMMNLVDWVFFFNILILIWAMNVIFLAECSLLFSGMSKAVCDESLRQESKSTWSCQAGSKKKNFCEH